MGRSVFLHWKEFFRGKNGLGGNLCLKENNKRKDVELYQEGKLKKVSLLVMSQS